MLILCCSEIVNHRGVRYCVSLRIFDKFSKMVSLNVQKYVAGPSIVRKKFSYEPHTLYRVKKNIHLKVVALDAIIFNKKLKYSLRLNFLGQ